MSPTRWPAGGFSSRTRIVIRIATTPSVKAFIRSGFTAALCQLPPRRARWDRRLRRARLGGDAIRSPAGLSGRSRRLLVVPDATAVAKPAVPERERVDDPGLLPRLDRVEV